jgi:hypothetical protein
VSDVLQGARTKDYVKEDIPGIENSGDKLRYVTLQDVQGKRAAMDVLIHGITVVSTGHTIDAGSARRLIKSTAHNAKVGYFIRPTSGNSAGEEIPVIKIIDADTLVIAALFDLAIGDTFELIKPVTPNYTSTGDLNVVVSESGPIQYELDGVNTVVKKDTVTPGNSRSLPVNILNDSGQTYDLATQTTLLSIASDIAIIKNLTRKEVSEFLFFDYTGVSNAGYTEIISSVAADIKSMTWFESSGQPMVVAVGAVGLEVDKFVIPPGGFNGEIPMDFELGDRVSIKQLNAEALGSGIMIVANFFK